MQARLFSPTQRLHDVHTRRTGSGQQRREDRRGPRQRDSAERTGNDSRGRDDRALAEDAGQQMTRRGSDGEDYGCGRLLIGVSVLSPHEAPKLVVKLVLDFKTNQPPVDGRKTAGSNLPSPS